MIRSYAIWQFLRRITRRNYVPATQLVEHFDPLVNRFANCVECANAFRLFQCINQLRHDVWFGIVENGRRAKIPNVLEIRRRRRGNDF